MEILKSVMQFPSFTIICIRYKAILRVGKSTKSMWCSLCKWVIHNLTDSLWDVIIHIAFFHIMKVSVFKGCDSNSPNFKSCYK